MRRNYPVYILIAAFVIVFGWFGLDKFLNPILWIGFLPQWLEGFLGMTRNTWLMIMGVLEILFAVLLLIPYRRIRQIAAALIALHLLVVVLQVGWNDVGVRDLGLLLSAGALFLLL